eukprot:TRINITY_DN1371_c0_g1_i1.p1 TRINITY_DN1371_c0_g1~~TRINITY_DN1371_c0_g1_i1.p1  ORF type:complete len:766 (+),score=186.20 TRINITY_DN1371_c0_g1_i1:55-2298(+)
MALSEEHIKTESKLQRFQSVFGTFILGAICILAFSVRLFSVIRYESVIHEFDPWFNFRATRYLTAEGFYNFHNWFDNMTWYPYGRYVGGTVYPGLMNTAAVIFHLLNSVLRFTVDIRNVCVMLAPFFASLTCVATYLLTSEIWNSSAGIVAAAFISIAPGYISRSVAGSYDNEAIAIFAMVLTFYLWVKAVKTGSMFWGGMCALGYFYMVAAWGGYIFIINLIPFHVLVVLLTGRYSHRMYVAYCSFYCIGTLMSMMIPFVQFIPVSSPEHMGAMGIFILLQLYNMVNAIRAMLSPERVKKLFYYGLFLIAILVALFIVLAITGSVPFLTGRLLSLLGSTSNIAIVKSVSEHQPSPWTTFFFDMHFVMIMAAAGIYFCFDYMNDASIFAILYILFASYFSAVMVRLVLVLTPVCCVLAGIATSHTLHTFVHILYASNVHEKEKEKDEEDDNKDSKLSSGSSSSSSSSDEKKKKSPSSLVSTSSLYLNKGVALCVLSGFMLLFYFFVIHCTWVTSTAYSSPSVVLMSRQADGTRVVFDDFREAYGWLRHNTHPSSRIASWWDYGYQITGMGNRTTIVDNNTRNNTHIAIVGFIMASSEDRAYPFIRMLDIDYLLVVFGGYIGYSSDDINKFLWMVRISGGIFPEVVEREYFNAQGQYRVDATAPKRMTNCLMYKMCYYRFGEVLGYGGGSRPVGGFDRVRYTEIGEKDIKFKYLEEAFTSEHWMVRIYRVKNEKSHPNYLERLDRIKS